MKMFGTGQRADHGATQVRCPAPVKRAPGAEQANGSGNFTASPIIKIDPQNFCHTLRPCRQIPFGKSTSTRV